MKPAVYPMKWYFMGAPDKLGLAGTYGSKIDAHFTYVLFLASSFLSSDRHGQPGLSLMVGLSSATRTISIG